ncbi:hypothetical protein J4450_04245 [Candidatus Micrarchaeota archaeon]|nr:hypothetical protein [Candidatus Micrarchaeota archaeon]
MDHRESLKKAAAIARIKLSAQEEERLVSEIDEALKVFSKIDAFKDYVEEPKFTGARKLRSDSIKKCDIDPFSNSKLIKNRKFIGPKLVD